MADAQWGQHLPALSGLPLLPCGAGTDRKAPIEPGTGLQMAGTTQLASRVDQMWPLGLGVVGVVVAMALA
jgi:hypothetical protein